MLEYWDLDYWACFSRWMRHAQATRGRSNPCVARAGTAQPRFEAAHQNVVAASRRRPRRADPPVARSSPLVSPRPPGSALPTSMFDVQCSMLNVRCARTRSVESSPVFLPAAIPPGWEEGGGVPAVSLRSTAGYTLPRLRRGRQRASPCGQVHQTESKAAINRRSPHGWAIHRCWTQEYGLRRFSAALGFQGGGRRSSDAKPRPNSELRTPNSELPSRPVLAIRSWSSYSAGVTSARRPAGAA